VTTKPLPSFAGRPEQLFGMDTIHQRGDLVAGSMHGGPWLHEPTGNIHVGALGVLVDNVLGYAIHAARPDGCWSVSTEINIGACSTNTPASPLTAEATVVHSTPTGGLATGRVVDADGTLVAVCSQRGRFVPVHESVFAPRDVPDIHAVATSIPELIGLTSRTDLHAELQVTQNLQNPMGNLHGGITICVSELLAGTALAATEGPTLETASVSVIYARPIAPDSTAMFEATVRHRGRSLGIVDVTVAVEGRVCVRANVVAHA
jgi:uncharacterized protein (TIGR00369 family)